MKIFLSLLIIILLSFPLISQQITSEKRIEELISKMSLEEKVDFIGGYHDYTIRPVPRLGIPQIFMADGPTGVRSSGPSTAYPAAINLAASWDAALAERVGNAIGKEAKAKNVHIMLGPAMNIHRAPMCGRNFEYLGEDPFLAGRIASMYIKGMQREGVIATAKHFMANYQEYDRHHISSDMDERTLREIYLPAFQASVVEGHAAAIMTSYNLINGIYASQHNYLLNKILKDELKFDGIIMSDWASTYDGIAAANGGLDLEMPSGKAMCRDTLIPAVKSGRVSEKTIDDKIRRILRQYVRFGFFKNPDISKGYTLDSAFVQATALDAARGGIVLLKNEGNILPLNLSMVKRIALIGPNAHPAVTGGGGSSFIQALHPLSLFEELKQVGGGKVNVAYESGLYDKELMPAEFFDRANFYTIADGKLVPGLDAEYYSHRWPEGNPDYRQHVTKMNLEYNNTVPGVAEDRFFVRFSGFLKVDTSGRYRFVVSTDGGFRLSINDHDVGGSWGNFQETVYSAIVSLDAGKENRIILQYYQHRKKGSLRLGYESEREYKQKSAQRIQQAVELAKQSDLVVVCAGFNAETEREDADRPFKLPDEQESLIYEATKIHKDIIVVLNAGGNVDMNGWLAQTKALIHAWYPGQSGNLALAEILLGATNPSGKLPVSFEKHWEDNAAFKSYYDDDGDKHVKFGEGIFLGYRHFDRDSIEPQFPFGFGLSYTTFEYSNLKANKERFKASEPLEVTLSVKNTGKHDGAEIVQLYVNDPVSSLPRPVKELKAFTKVMLKVGQIKEVKFALNADAFKYFNPDKMQWVVEPGDFNILIGSSSRDIRLKKKVAIIE